MLDNPAGFEGIRLTVCENPFESPRSVHNIYPGGTILQIMSHHGEIDEAQFLKLRVVLIKGTNVSTVPFEFWGKVKPKAGTYIHIEPNVEGAILAPLLSTIVTAAAPAIAGTLFTAGTFAHLLATAAISVLGMLAIRAIIPPPNTETQTVEEDPTFNIDLAANEAQPYSPYPMCFGRHIVYPLKTATGYTETVGDEIYLRERMTFGYGPLALESLKIGDTDITEFDGVEVEFLNVNRAQTLANIPALAAKMKKKTRQTETPNFRIGGQATDLFDPPPPGTTANEYIFTPDEPITRLEYVVQGRKRIEQAPGPQPWVNQRTTNGFEQSGAYTLLVSERPAGSAVAWTQIASHNLPNGGSEQRQTTNVTTGSQQEYKFEIALPDEDIDVCIVRRVVAVFDPANPNSGFRFGSAKMTLYPDDISEVDLSVLLEAGVQHVRTTAVGVEAAQVDFSFNGLAIYSPKGARGPHTVEIDVEYREVGDAGAWTLVERKACTGNTGQFIRFTSEIVFPDVGQYDIRITRFTADNAASNLRDESTWTTLRNIQPGDLPSHPGIAEVAVRIRASEQLNGRIDTLNAVVQQLAPVWDGSSWSAPQPIRHPAWAYARALMGPMSGHGVGRARIDADGLKAWADEEPHWTCDMWLTGERSMANVLDLIAASGRARRGMSSDLKYSVIREFGAAAPIVQHFTPRNSWDFKGIKFLEKELHAIRARVVSEAKGWQTDEVLIYNDGFDEGTATEIETMTMPGVVLTSADTDQSNVYRLGRYHIAVAALRHEQFTFMTDLDHLPVRYGDKIRIVHDVPLFGVGSARIKDIDGDRLGLTLDDAIPNAVNGTTYRLRVRPRNNGTEDVYSIEYDGQGRFINSVPAIDTSSRIGDLALVERTTQDTAELLVTAIRHDEDLRAEITAVPAADAVLDAATGTIPDYNPIITNVPAGRTPPKPTVISTRSDRDTARITRAGELVPRIGVRIKIKSQRGVEVPLIQVRWRKTETSASGAPRNDWRTREPRVYREEVLTGNLDNDTEYQVQVRSINPLNGKTRGWVGTGLTTTSIGTGELELPDDWTGFGDVDGITFSGSEATGGDLKNYRLFGQRNTDNVRVFLKASKEPTITYVPKPSDNFAGYRIQAFDFDDQPSNETSLISAAPVGVSGGNLLTDTDFSDGLLHWNGFNGTNPAFSESTASATVASDKDILLINQAGSDASGNARIQFEPLSLVNGDAALGVPVDGDQFYSASVRARPARCSGVMRLRWFDGTQTFISSNAIDIPADAENDAGFNQPQRYRKVSGIFQAPTDARWLQIRFEKNGTIAPEVDSNLRLFQPFVGKATANTVLASPYSPGKTGLVGENRIITDAVIARHILAGSVVTDKLDAEAVTAGKLAANSVIAGKIAADAVTAAKIDARTITADEISVGGITFEELANQAATEWNRQAQGSFTPAALGVSETIFTLTLNDTLNSEPWRVVAGGRGRSGGNVNNIAYQFQRRLRRTSSSPWSAWQTIAVSFQFLFDTEYTAFNFFESFGGTWGTVQYRLRASVTTSDSNPPTVTPCQNNYLLAEFSRR